jgi:hypothetical protein
VQTAFRTKSYQLLESVAIGLRTGLEPAFGAKRNANFYSIKTVKMEREKEFEQ